jgi:hypothetical protein
VIVHKRHALGLASAAFARIGPAGPLLAEAARGFGDYGATVVWKLTPGMWVPSGTPLMNWTPL